MKAQLGTMLPRNKNIHADYVKVLRRNVNDREDGNVNDREDGFTFHPGPY